MILIWFKLLFLDFPIPCQREITAEAHKIAWENNFEGLLLRGGNLLPELTPKPVSETSPMLLSTRRMAIANWTCVSWVIAYAPGTIAVNSLSIHVTFTAIVPGAYHAGESKMWLKTLIRSRKHCQKPVTRDQYLAISQKWLKIAGYMMRGVDKHWIFFRSMWHLPRWSQGRRLPSWRTFSWR